MRGQVAARPIGLLLGLQASAQPARQVGRLRDRGGSPAGRAGRGGSPSRSSAREILAELEAVSSDWPFSALDKVFDLGDPPDYEPEPAASVAATPQRDGRQPLELLYDLLLGDEGRALLYLPFLNYGDGNLDAAGEMLAHRDTVPGLGDGGAHVGTICDASFPTTLLTHWARDRDRGARLDLAVRRAAAEPRHRRGRRPARPRAARARLPGRRQRDRLRQPAARPAPRSCHDLPAGGKRLVQRADGYVHTIVAGVETYDDGEPTGALPGRLVRGPQVAATSSGLETVGRQVGDSRLVGD